MTFDDKLDEILTKLNNDAQAERISCTERGNWEGYNFAHKKLEDKAKQAIKDLVLSDVVGEDYVASGSYPISNEQRYSIAVVNQKLNDQRNIINAKENSNE